MRVFLRLPPEKLLGEEFPDLDGEDLPDIPKKDPNDPHDLLDNPSDRGDEDPFRSICGFICPITSIMV